MYLVPTIKSSIVPFHDHAREMISKTAFNCSDPHKEVLNKVIPIIRKLVRCPYKDTTSCTQLNPLYLVRLANTEVVMRIRSSNMIALLEHCFVIELHCSHPRNVSNNSVSKAYTLHQPFKSFRTTSAIHLYGFIDARTGVYVIYIQPCLKTIS